MRWFGVSFPDDRLRQVARPVGLLVATSLAVAVGLVVATGSDSTTEAHLRSLHRTLLAIALPVVALVEGLLVYAVFRTGRSRTEGDPAASSDGYRRIELAWALATALILIVVGLLSYGVMAQPSVLGGPAGTDQPDADVTITVTAEQYDWTFSYGDSRVRTSKRLVLPVDRTVTLRITSRDVIHSVSVPGLGLKRDALPAQYTTVRTTPTSTGTYELYCAEFCGAGHADMTATVEVVSASEFESWLARHG